MRWWLHWMVSNIPGNNLLYGTTLTDYMGPSPPHGVHRYVFLLAEQHPGVDVSHSAAPRERGKFDPNLFLSTHSLDPVGINLFTCQAGH